MADGMDKAFFLSTAEENAAFAYHTLWTAAVQHDGAAQVQLGVLPLRTGGFAIVSRQDTDYQAWMLSSTGELRPLEAHHVVRLIGYL